MSERPLHGRTALVTGASRGVGRAIALALAREGANVLVNFRERVGDAEQVVREIECIDRDPPRAMAVRADVSERVQVRSLLRCAVQTFGGLDILVNNAGLLQQKPFVEITDGDWDRTLAVNLKSVFICVQESVAELRRSGRGRIVNIASSGGQLGGTLAPHYAAAKSGTIALTRSFARLLAPEITVNCIAPGLIETDMTAAEIASPQGRHKLEQIPLARVGAPEDVAAAAVFLVASGPYVTGHTLNVNGGLYFG